MHTTSLTIKNRLTCKIPVKSHQIKKKKLGVFFFFFLKEKKENKNIKSNTNLKFYLRMDHPSNKIGRILQPNFVYSRIINKNPLSHFLYFILRSTNHNLLHLIFCFLIK